MPDYRRAWHPGGTYFFTIPGFLMYSKRCSLGVVNGCDGLTQRACDQPALLFGALDADQARQLRRPIGDALPLYGASSVNPGLELAMPELDGMRLLDLPWQIEPFGDGPARFERTEPTAVYLGGAFMPVAQP